MQAASGRLFFGDDLLEIGNDRLHLAALFDHLGHLVAGVDDRGMIAAKGVADARQRKARHLAGFCTWHYTGLRDQHACYAAPRIDEARGADSSWSHLMFFMLSASVSVRR